MDGIRPSGEYRQDSPGSSSPNRSELLRYGKDVSSESCRHCREAAIPAIPSNKDAASADANSARLCHSESYKTPAAGPGCGRSGFLAVILLIVIPPGQTPGSFPNPGLPAAGSPSRRAIRLRTPPSFPTSLRMLLRLQCPSPSGRRWRPLPFHLAAVSSSITRETAGRPITTIAYS